MKYFGKIGFWEANYQERPGVIIPKIVEKEYFGELTYQTLRWNPTNSQTDDLNISNTLSIISDTYCLEHFNDIKYIILNGIKLKVSSISIEPPRVVLSIGGEYNG